MEKVVIEQNIKMVLLPPGGRMNKYIHLKKK